MRNKIFDFLIESLKIYYGLDWIAFLTGITGMYLLSEKNKLGFIFQSISVFCSLVVASIALQYGFIVSNTVTFIIVIYGYFNWETQDKKK